MNHAQAHLLAATATTATYVNDRPGKSYADYLSGQDRQRRDGRVAQAARAAVVHHR